MSLAHRISAVRYARHERPASENFLGGLGGDAGRESMPLDYYVWVIERDEGEPILVDTGFGAKAAENRGRAMLRGVDEGLAAMGLQADCIQDVILTHLHYDHAGRLDLFPAARFHVQDAEMAMATGRMMGSTSVRAPFDGEPVARMVDLLFSDRVVFHAGDEEVFPGVILRALPGHTSGLQGVEVATARGPVVLASDAAHLYANLVRRVPFPIVVDVPAYMAALDRVSALAPGLDHIIPGHDPLVLAAFPPGAAPDIARVDLAPHTSLESLL